MRRIPVKTEYCRPPLKTIDTEDENNICAKCGGEYRRFGGTYLKVCKSCKRHIYSYAIEKVEGVVY